MPRSSARPTRIDCAVCGRPLRKGQRQFCSMKCVEAQAGNAITPEELAERAAAIRDGWSLSEERGRRAILERAWSIPEVSRPNLHRRDESE